MSRVVIIGGSGHVGTYLVPRLVEAGFDVVNVSRGERRPYQPNPAWDAVRSVTLDRDAEEKAGTFASRIRDLQPDIVIDMICFRPDSARHLVDALRGHIRHFLLCGTIWVHGPSVEVPTAETAPRRPLGEYGIQKAAIEAFLLGEAEQNGFPATIVHPGHIVGPGWVPLNPAGHFNPLVFATLARGEELALANFGMETVHHVHADDVAQLFTRAIDNSAEATGQAFHAVSPAAVTLRGYAEAMSAVVRPHAQSGVPALAGMEGAADRARRRCNLGAHLPQPQLQHRQGAAPARLRTTLRLAGGGARVRGVADRAGDRRDEVNGDAALPEGGDARKLSPLGFWPRQDRFRGHQRGRYCRRSRAGAHSHARRERFFGDQREQGGERRPKASKRIALPITP